MFYLKREREERARGRSAEEALEVAAATSGRSVLISGCTVLVAMAGMVFTGDADYASFGVATMTVVAVAMLGSLTVLPALLSKLGDNVDRLRVPFAHRLRREDGEGRFWGAIIDRVLRHPALSAGLAAGALLLLAVPAYQLHTANPSIDTYPQNLLQTYNRMKTAFPAGKEFRFFDIRTTRYKTERVQTLQEEKHLFQATLFPDEIRNNNTYLYRKDINGKFFPGTLDFFDQNAQADYLWVTFRLPVDYPLKGGKIYLLGKFTDWQLQEPFLLHFNATASAYETTLFLKQGYYEYLYNFLSDDAEDPGENLIEGNDYETENTYQVLVYYRPFGSRYDQVIGYKSTDTFNR